MEEILNKLYSNEYFGIYLMISIVVLILIFIIVLFFGKKDKKIREVEATKKLQQINSDAFKDDSIEEKLDIVNMSEEKLENDTIIVPSIESISNINEVSENEIPEPVLPKVEDNTINEENTLVEEEKAIEEPEVNITLEEEIKTISTIETENNEELTPLLDKIEEKPLIFNEFTSKIEIPKIEEIKMEVPTPKEEVEKVEVPTFNFDEIIQSVEETKKEQTYSKGPQIFSSVYVPEKEKVEMPKIEKKPTYEDELDFELPTLKKSEPVKELPKEEIELPILNDYNLDNLSGETYTLNK